MDLHAVNGDAEAHKGEEDRDRAEPGRYDPVVVCKGVGEVQRPRRDPEEDEQKHIVQRHVFVLRYLDALEVVDDHRDGGKDKNCHIHEEHQDAEVVLVHGTPALSTEPRVAWLIDFLDPDILWGAQACVLRR